MNWNVLIELAPVGHRSAALRPGGALPAGLPAGTQLHASLADFVDQLLPVAPGATGAVGTVGAAPLPLS